jgi:hydroxyacylglutathione hydrolase
MDGTIIMTLHHHKIPEKLALNNLNIYILPVTPFEQNCSIMHCTKSNEAAIVDPGGEINRIHACILEHNMQPKYILLTHGHLDHCGQTMQLAHRLGVPVYGPHKDDIFWLAQLGVQSERYFAQYGFEHTHNFIPDMWVDEGQKILLGEHTIDIIHTPGHTPGHVVFYIKHNKIAWVGDVLFKNGIGRSDFPMGNTKQLMHSIMHKLLPLGDDIRFICGHGSTSTLGEERMFNPYLN